MENSTASQHDSTSKGYYNRSKYALDPKDHSYACIEAQKTRQRLSEREVEGLGLADHDDQTLSLYFITRARHGHRRNLVIVIVGSVRLCVVARGCWSVVVEQEGTKKMSRVGKPLSGQLPLLTGAQQGMGMP